MFFFKLGNDIKSIKPLNVDRNHRKEKHRETKKEKGQYILVCFVFYLIKCLSCTKSNLCDRKSRVTKPTVPNLAPRGLWE